ncbi:MAG TPA: Gfo/Idh/MocA family oxidoreductase [Polyangiaceae bacterium]|nr:Gfo/Idh/MocA family oxidoreductase [Polyangiaceae bacterium]
MKSRTVRRALFVGLGGVGQRHLRNFVAVAGSDVELLAYRVRRERQVLSDALCVQPDADLESQYPLRVFSNLNEALVLRPDVTIVANPTSQHVPVALSALDAGSDLFVEKPLSHDADGVDDLASVAERRGLIHFVAYQLRQHPDFRRLQAWLAAGRIGRVYAARFEVGEYLPDFHPYEDYRRMYASRSELGGGVILTQIHELDMAYALFGMPRSVFSLGGRVSDLEIDVEDMAVSTLEYRHADGRILPVSVHQDYLSRPKRRAASFIGESGRIEWCLSENRLRMWDASGASVEEFDTTDFARNQMFVDEMRHFLDCVRTRTPTEISLRDGAASLRIGLALKRSQQSGRAVVLGEGPLRRNAAMPAMEAAP